MIRFTPMSDQDLKTSLSPMWEDYRNQLLGAGYTTEEATLNIGARLGT